MSSQNIVSYLGYSSSDALNQYVVDIQCRQVIYPYGIGLFGGSLLIETAG